MALNKHGLSRTIPPAVKQFVRKRCGFGCVVCGRSIIQYHHFNPEFSDATEHTADGITLLCGTHHQETHAGIISAKQIAGHNAKPFSIVNGHSTGLLRPENKYLPVRFGSSTIISPCIIRYDDEVVIGLFKPENDDDPILFSATFMDTMGNVTLRIEENEWQIGANNFDVAITKDELVIKGTNEEVVLRMRLSVDAMIVIDELRMDYRGFKIEANPGSFSVAAHNGGRLIHNGSNIAEIGIWLKSSGQALIAANQYGGAAICIGQSLT
jgi:hypothetical protein